MNNLNSRIDWQCKSCDEYDMEIAANFRNGTLKEGDIYKVSKYVEEGLTSVLVLRTSIILFGCGWLRYIPTGNSNASKVGGRFRLSKRDELNEESSLLLMNSILNACRGNQNFQQGQLINAIISGEMPIEAYNNRTVQRKQRFIPQPRVPQGYYDGSSSLNNSFISDRLSHQAYNPNIPELLPLNSYENQDDILLGDNSFSNHLPIDSTPAPKRQMIHANNNHNNLIPQSNTILNEANDSYLNIPQESWYNIEERDCPSGIPIDLKTRILAANWPAKEPNLKGKETAFNEVILQLFTAARSAVSEPYQETDLKKDPYQLAQDHVDILVKCFNHDTYLTEKKNILLTNQSFWILGNCIKVCPISNMNILKRKVQKLVTENTKLPRNIFAAAATVVNIWGLNAPLSRMRNLNIPIYNLIGTWNTAGVNILARAMRDLENQYPHSI